MKNSVKVLTFISIALIVMNCAHDDEMPVKGNVQFAVSVSAKASDGGRAASNVFPDSAYVSLSVETTSGVSVYSLKRIELIKLGDGYITAPVAMTEGAYRLTDFMIRSKNNEVLYATPKEGSSLASLVDDPLPVNFSITKDGILNLDIQVVSATQQTPEDFGYVSFGVKVVGGDFSISLFTMENDTLNLTTGILSLYQGDEVVFTQNLLSKVNPVNFKGDPNATYTLLVEKEGFTLKSKTYVLHSLIDELHGNPLAVMLAPASTFKVFVKEFSKMAIHLTTPHDDVYIDWGDGVVEHVTTMSGDYPELVHDYQSVGRYFVNITGSLNFITEYWFTWVDYNLPPEIEDLDITQLRGLKSFVLEGRISPKEISFSHNTKLEFLSLNSTTIEQLDISNNPLLNYLEVGRTQLIPIGDPDNYSKIIGILTILTTHVTANNIRGGSFVYGAPWEGPQPDELEEKVINLRENYGWHFYGS